jgi:arginyl-tRNA synthetase
LNHVGDWGTQFGMLIYYIKQIQPEILEALNKSNLQEYTEKDIQHLANQLNIQDLVAFYKLAKQQFDASIEFQEGARLEVVKLQSGDAQNTLIWKAICEKSRQEFQIIYDLLQVTLQERGESFYNPYLSPLVQELTTKGVVSESEGAKCIFLAPKAYKNMDGSELPLIIQKSDGGFLYATTDLAALKHRIEIEKAQRLIYITDAGQAQHFAMVFDAGRLANIIPSDDRVDITHVPFGLVLGEDGKKIKTRSGESVKLKDLLMEGIKIAEESFLKRYWEEQQSLITTPLTVEDTSATTEISLPKLEDLNPSVQTEIQRKAKILGIAAVKYADLAMNRESNYKFSFHKMLSLQGNTAPYMLYAYVRIQGIKRKAIQTLFATENKNDVPISEWTAENIDQELLQLFSSSNQLILQESEEMILAKHLIRFDESLLEVSNRLYPNKVIIDDFRKLLDLLYPSYSYVIIYLSYLKNLINFMRNVLL